MAQPDNNNTLSSALNETLRNDAENVKAAWKAEYKIHSDVACLMLGKMSPALQRQFELYFLQAMLTELRKMFEKPPGCRDLDFRWIPTQLGKQAPGNRKCSLCRTERILDPTPSSWETMTMIWRSNFDHGPLPVLAIQKGRVNKPKPQANKKGKGKGKADKNKQVVAYQTKTKQNLLEKEQSKTDQACHHTRSWSLEEECLFTSTSCATNKNKMAEHGAAASDLPILARLACKSFNVKDFWKVSMTIHMINANLVFLGR
ncbi:hypothetical protein Tco_0064167 [Tanacetum coccineum]